MLNGEFCLVGRGGGGGGVAPGLKNITFARAKLVPVPNLELPTSFTNQR